jgi:hypothetical protein
MTEFSVPRLVEVYETLNAYEPGTQPDFYADLAAELGAVSIVDVGWHAHADHPPSRPPT